MLGRDRTLNDYFPWLDHATENAVALANGSAFVMARLEGFPWETAGQEVHERLHVNLNESFQQLATDGLVIHVWQCRGFANPAVYPQGRFTKPYAEALDMEYRARLFDQSMWDNQIFIGLQLQPRRIGGEFVGGKMARLRRRKTVHDEAPETRIERLDQLYGLLKETLTEYRPTRLGVAWRGATGMCSPRLPRRSPLRRRGCGAPSR